MVSRALVSVLVYLNGLFAIGLFKRQIKMPHLAKKQLVGQKGGNSLKLI
ncbi:hypothetical protein [Streptococcus uberis]|nr:hypothetical protein [Streptococcus uberis]